MELTFIKQLLMSQALGCGLFILDFIDSYNMPCNTTITIPIFPWTKVRGWLTRQMVNSYEWQRGDSNLGLSGFSGAFFYLTRPLLGFAFFMRWFLTLPVKQCSDRVAGIFFLFLFFIIFQIFNYAFTCTLHSVRHCIYLTNCISYLTYLKQKKPTSRNI